MPTRGQQIDAAMRYFGERDLDSWSNYILAGRRALDFERGRLGRSRRPSPRAWSTVRGVAPVTRICALAVLARCACAAATPARANCWTKPAPSRSQSGELQRLAPVAAAFAEEAWLRNDGTPVDDSCSQPMPWPNNAMTGGRWASCDTGACAWASCRPGRKAPKSRTPCRSVVAGRRPPTLWQRLGCPYERALALLEGDEAAMRDALTLLESLDASATVKRCREHLRDAGVRGVVPRSARDDQSANPAGLTSRELQILSLLAEDLTNAEIARRIVRSEKTVDHHISAILRKLDVRSRNDAAAMAGRLGLIPERRARPAV